MNQLTRLPTAFEPAAAPPRRRRHARNGVFGVLGTKNLTGWFFRVGVWFRRQSLPVPFLSILFVANLRLNG